MIIPIIITLRPKQWAKNVLVFAGLIFSQSFFETRSLLLSILAFTVFCLTSSAIYVINDLCDAPNDRLHPTKRSRPIASGKVPPSIALALFVGLVCLSTGLLLLIGNIGFSSIVATYFAMMLLYVFWLKHCVILDIICIASGFILRAIAGVVVLQTPERNIPLTAWFICSVFFLSLFLVVCKRRHEVSILSRDDAKQHRKVLNEYSLPFLDQMVSITTTATIMSYALYSVSGVYSVQGTIHMRHPDWLVWTLPFVVYGTFRYLYLVYQKAEGGAPESLLFDDPGIIICVLMWTITIIICLCY